MKSYIYRLYAIDKRNNTIIKTMLGNDKSQMQERFEKWFIKSNFTGARYDVKIDFDFVQHAGY